MKKLRVNKNDVVYFHLFRWIDKANANTYNMFGECFIVRKGQRKYFSDMLSDEVWKPYKSFYGYDDHYAIAKQWLNDNSNLNMRYISDYPNVIVSSEYINTKDFNKLKRNYDN